MSVRRLVPLGLGLCALFAAPSCGLGPRVLVVVELQTDLAPQFEFTEVRTSIGDEVDVLAVGGTTFFRPARVAELRVSPGTVNVRVQLVDPAGRVRGERLVVAEVRRDTGVVAFISAACRGVECPAQGETCIRGTCTDARSVCDGAPCRPGEEECAGSECDHPLRFCPRGVCDDDCTSAADCASTDPCSMAVCESSVCVGVPREGECPSGFFCAVGIGCTEVPEGIDAGTRDGGVPSDAGIDYCTTCTTSCGTPGFGVCEDGVATGECHPPDEYCNGRDEDCDTRVDEGLACDHEHDIVCELGVRPIPGTDDFEPNVVDAFGGGGPGRLCAGPGCSDTITSCRTLPGPFDGHVHDVSLGGVSGTSLTVLDDVPFALIATVATASDHTHGARCGLGTTGIEVEGGLAFHRIAPMGDDEVLTPSGRYDQLCVAPVGDPTTACYPAFGFCETGAAP